MIKSIGKAVKKVEYSSHVSEYGMNINVWFWFEDFSFQNCHTNNKLGKWWA